ncbi:MAG TPA: DUF4157 domain-containing protein [Caulobacteraceae bacterium]|jgi:hypothetical protein
MTRRSLTFTAADRAAPDAAAVPRRAACAPLGNQAHLRRLTAKAQPSAREAGGTAPPVVHQVLAAPGQALDPATNDFMASRFGADFSGVRIHTDARAAESAAAVGAEAYTVGSHVVFGAGRFDTASDGGRRLIAHELAHTLQAGAGGWIARKTLTDIPEAIRKGLHVTRNAPDEATVDGWVSTYFNPKGGVSANPAAGVEFGAEITDVQQQKGLKGAAHDLADMATVLPPGTIIDVAIDLSKQGGPNAIFRFTRYVDGAAEKILIERTQVQAAAPAPPQTGQQGAAGGAAAPVLTGMVAVGAIKVDLGASFSADQAKQLVDALNLLPAPILAKADGVTFSFMGAGAGPGNEAGEYQAEKDIIHIWGDMFKTTARRIGTGTDAQAGIIHELGHMIDLRPSFGAQIARDKAVKTRDDLQNQLDHPKIDINDPDPLAATGDSKSPKQAAEEKRLKDAIAAAQKEIDAQNVAMQTAKSLAGGELGDKKDSEQMLTDFGKALTADGVKPVKDARKTNRKIDADNEKADAFNKANPTAQQKPITPDVKTLTGDVTDYADTNLMEAFAENFSLYILDEALLSAIRPATFAFFQKALPKKPPAAAGTGAKP